MARLTLARKIDAITLIIGRSEFRLQTVAATSSLSVGRGGNLLEWGECTSGWGATKERFLFLRYRDSGPS
jgi:hypothetical protein